MPNRGVLSGLKTQPVFPIPPGVIWEYSSDTLPNPAIYGEWLWADNALVSQAKYPDLFKAIGYAHTPGNPGADPGGGNFYLPNRKGNAGVGKDAGQTEFNALGKTGGSKTSTAAHDHSLNGHTHALATHDHSSNTHVHGMNDHWHAAGSHTHGISHEHNVNAGLGGGNVGLSPGGSNYNLLEQTKSTFNGPANTGGPSAGGSWVEGWLNVGGNTGTSGASVTGATNVGTAQGPNTPNSGASSVGAASGNLQPYVVCNYIVKT